MDYDPTAGRGSKFQRGNPEDRPRGPAYAHPMRWTHDFMYAKAVAKDRGYDGRFYTAVTTTGIYCLPSCPARKPKTEHVRFFSSELEAQGEGFRPCLRCHPERFRPGVEPELDEVETLLARVRATPDRFRRVGELVAASGLGATQLAERFRRHLHAAPVLVLQRLRLEAAARMLREAALPLSEVAWAAGYDSASTFHDQFRRHYALAPGAYRNLAEQEQGFCVALPRGYRGANVLAFHGRDPQSHSERVEGGTLWKALEWKGQAVVVELQVEEGRARVQAHGSAPFVELNHALHAQVLRLLGLVQDPAPFERSLAHDTAFQALVRERSGLRIPQTASVWEALVWAILGQQVNLAFAYALRRDLTLRAGLPTAFGLHAHPSPEAVAELDLADLQALRLSRAKAEALLGAARAVVARTLDLEALPLGTATRAEARLLGLKGVGPWTARYVLMRGCGFGDCVPVGDAALVKALQRQFHLEHRPGLSETEALLAPFAPHRSLAVFHLWASLKGTPA